MALPSAAARQMLTSGLPRPRGPSAPPAATPGWSSWARWAPPGSEEATRSQKTPHPSTVLEARYNPFLYMIGGQQAAYRPSLTLAMLPPRELVLMRVWSEVTGPAVSRALLVCTVFMVRHEPNRNDPSASRTYSCTLPASIEVGVVHASNMKTCGTLSLPELAGLRAYSPARVTVAPLGILRT